MFSSVISFSSSVGISSGPGAFLLFIFFIAALISSMFGGFIEYPCPSCGTIGVSFSCGVSCVSLPHCVSLKYFAACCALCL
jgi:hypothetical protein